MNATKKDRQRKKSNTAAIIRYSRPLWREKYFDIKTSHNYELDTAPRCIVVTPRAVGNAVKRNKIKRQMRSIYHQLDLQKTKRHWIFFCKKNATSYSFQELLLFTKNALERFEKKNVTPPAPAEKQNKENTSLKKAEPKDE